MWSFGCSGWFKKEKGSSNGPLDTVKPFCVPSFLCLRCQPLNGVLKSPQKAEVPSQLLKERVYCDAFHPDVNTARKGVLESGNTAGTFCEWGRKSDDLKKELTFRKTSITEDQNYLLSFLCFLSFAISKDSSKTSIIVVIIVKTITSNCEINKLQL